MERPIDANALFDLVERWYQGSSGAEHRRDREFLNLICDMPTLALPNEVVSRTLKLDELYTKVRSVTGFTVEQLLDMFSAGYTMEKPDYSKAFIEMEHLVETTLPNEPLMLNELRQMDGEPVWIEIADGCWGLVDAINDRVLLKSGVSVDISLLEGIAYCRPRGEELNDELPRL